MTQTDAAAEIAKGEMAQRMAAAFASMRDGTADAKQVRESLRASRKPRRHVPVARVQNRTVPGLDGCGEIPEFIAQQFLVRCFIRWHPTDHQEERHLIPG